LGKRAGAVIRQYLAMRGTPFQPGPFHPNRPGLILPVAVDPAGLSGPSRKQARGPEWRRTSQGFYVPVTADAHRPEQRIAEGSIILPSFGAVTGWAALRWFGGIWFDGLTPDGRTELPVALATGYDDVRRQPGVLITQERLGPSELLMLDAISLTTAQRALCFEMRYAVSLREAVVAMDMAAYSDLASLEEAISYAAAHPGWTGIPQARKALNLADENSWSPWETRMRLIWMLDAGFPKPLCNSPVFDRNGRHIGTPDIFDPEAGLVGEYDGALHLEGTQRSRDLRREDRFRSVGLDYFTIVSTDITNKFRAAERMDAARRRARWLPESQREWTVQTPSWWQRSISVEQRRDLSSAERERYLRNRRRVS
jgi:hypothetical protein